VEKKMILTAVCISVLLFSAVAGTKLLNLGKANPFTWLGQVPPDDDTKPPAIAIFPRNSTVNRSNNLTISFNVKLLGSPLASDPRVYTVYYNTSWQNDSVVYQWSYGHPYLTEFSNKLNLTSIPEGKQNITIQAIEYGIYWSPPPFWYTTFTITGSSSISFTIDTTPPVISALSVQNKTYSTSDVPLNVTVNEPVSQVICSLDGQENVTISGNTTLTGLANGDHSLIVYAKDEAGNIGTSKTITFTVAESFPTTLVATASVVTVAVVGAVTLLIAVVYFKKRKH
jgi:hypothetical protein